MAVKAPRSQKFLRDQLAAKYAREALREGLQWDDPAAVRLVARMSGLPDSACRMVLLAEAGGAK
ncbi:MAG: hypothetical protein WDA25_11240 [Paracoccaceae bacterium]